VGRVRRPSTRFVSNVLSRTLAGCLHPSEAMTARTATVRLYVAFAALVTALVSLAAALVRLTATGVSWAAARIEASTRPVAPQKPAAAPSQKPAAAPVARLRLVTPAPAAAPATGAPSAAERLTTGLMGVGYKAPQVRAFVASLGDRVEHEPMADLLKAGLAALTRAA
jgi:hypothetical protein